MACPGEFPFKDERTDDFTNVEGVAFGLPVDFIGEDWLHIMARHVDQQRLHLLLIQALQAQFFADVATYKGCKQLT